MLPVPSKVTNVILDIDVVLFSWDKIRRMEHVFLVGNNGCCGLKSMPDWWNFYFILIFDKYSSKTSFLTYIKETFTLVRHIKEWEWNRLIHSPKTKFHQIYLF